MLALKIERRLTSLLLHVHLTTCRAELLAHLGHALLLLGELGGVVAHLLRDARIEQNFGPHIEQKSASLCASLGSVSS